MILTDELKEKLSMLKDEAEKVEEFTNFRIFNLHELEKEQIGYSIDPNGNSLVSNEEGSWKHEWIVIGYENALTNKVKNMSKNGMKIKEISGKLDMSIKDIYRYLKRNSED